MAKYYGQLSQLIRINQNIKMRNKDELFTTGEIFSATDEELDNALKELSTGYVPNDMVRHREVIRGITVNAIKNQRHVEKIESRNQKLTYVIIGLTLTSIILYILGFIYK